MTADRETRRRGEEVERGLQGSIGLVPVGGGGLVAQAVGDCIMVVGEG